MGFLYVLLNPIRIIGPGTRWELVFFYSCNPNTKYIEFTEFTCMYNVFPILKIILTVNVKLKNNNGI